MLAPPVGLIAVVVLTWLLTACAGTEPGADPQAGRPVGPYASSGADSPAAVSAGAAKAPSPVAADRADGAWEEADRDVGIIIGRRQAYSAFPYAFGYPYRFSYPWAERYWYSPFARWPWNSGWGWPAYGYYDPYWRARWHDAERNHGDKVVCIAKQQACYARDDGDYRPAYRATRERYGRAAERDLRRRYRDGDGPERQRFERQDRGSVPLFVGPPPGGWISRDDAPDPRSRHSGSRERLRDRDPHGADRPTPDASPPQPASLQAREPSRAVVPAARQRPTSVQPAVPQQPAAVASPRRAERRSPEPAEPLGPMTKAKPTPKAERPLPQVQTPPPGLGWPPDGRNDSRGPSALRPPDQPLPANRSRLSRGEAGRIEQLR